MNDLIAGLHQAQAGVDQQQARLESLRSGARSEDIALYQQKYTDASSALIIAMHNSSLQVENAILRYADTLFTNGTAANPTIAVTTQSWNEKRFIEMSRVIAGEKLNAWKSAIINISASSDYKAMNDVRAVGRETITFVSDFLNRLGIITGNLSTSGSGLSQTVIDTYRLTINTASQTANSGASAEQTAYAVWTSAHDTLISQESGSKPEDINAQIAVLESAKAGVESALAKIGNSRIVAPISGTITQFDAKVGQQASPGTPLVSIIGNGGFEIEAGVSETDVGKLTIGNKVTMTLDAFPNETFAGSVFYIAPAQTNIQGVISYQIKISFATPDPRIKSGLTANIDIRTKQKDSALILPQYAILQNDIGTFVETLLGNVTTTTPVTLGIQDQNGDVEILSGVTEGEQVINIGLKTQ